MATRLQTMKRLATEEAKKLKKFATKEELGKLDFVFFDPGSPEFCIYGQMTGNCYSARANELIRKCCKRVYSPINKNLKVVSESKLNGAPYVLTQDRQTEYHSPIEVLVFKDEDCAAKLIPYLKGESKTLKL